MFLKILKYFLNLFLIIGIIIIGMNLFMVLSTNHQILTQTDQLEGEEIDCILVLGAGIRGNFPSPMLEDRLLSSISLYEQKRSPKILVSGDHMNKNYDEVNVMKDYLIGHKIPSQDIFMDHAGISTYDSIYRAKKIFGVKKMMIVTQKYHLYRALYIANALDIDAYGIASNPREYSNQSKREIREILARTKDFLKVLFKPTSKYLGEPIDITQNGDITND